MPQGPNTTVTLVPARLAGELDATAARTRFQGALVAEARDRLAPKGVGRMLDEAVDLLGARFPSIVGIAALIWLPTRLGTELLYQSGLDLDTVVMVQALVVPLQALAMVLTMAFVSAIAGGEIRGEHAPVGESVVYALRRLPGVAVIAFLTFIASMVLVCPCIFTTYLAQWIFAIAPAIYILEKPPAFQGAFDALGRSAKLVWGWGSFGRWLGWFVVASVMVSPFAAAPEALHNGMAREFVVENLGVRGAPLQVFLAVLGSVFGGLAMAYQAVIMVVYYFDTRVRKEGLDLEVRLAGLVRRNAVERATNGGAS